MTPLLTFANGDTDYIQKHNANYSNIQSAINALEALAGAAASTAANPGGFLSALFGSSVALIGSGSYAQGTSGTSLTFTSGFCWRPTLPAVVSKSSSSTVAFSGVTAGTYFIVVDASGAPTRTSDATDAIYSVVWSGTGFTTITKLAPIVWAAADWIAAQTSTALAATYTTLDGRLEAGETKAVAGDLARTWNKGRLDKNVAGGANVTLTATEANNFVLRFSGALTASIAVNIDLSTAPRGWIVQNDTTGNFTLQIKGSSGAGVKIAQGTKTWVMHDGTNVVATAAGPLKPAVASLAYASAVTADFSYADTVKMTLTGNLILTLSGAVDKQKCVVELTQGGAGGYTVTWGSEIRYGDDLTVLTLSTAVGKTDKIGLIYDATAGKYDAVAIMRGF